MRSGNPRQIRYNPQKKTWEVNHPKWGWLPCTVEQARMFYDFGYKVVMK